MSQNGVTLSTIDRIAIAVTFVAIFASVGVVGFAMPQPTLSTVACATTAIHEVRMIAKGAASRGLQFARAASGHLPLQ